MAPITKRVYWRGLQGRVSVNFNLPGIINYRSVVVVTAAEYNPLVVDLRIPVPGQTLPVAELDDRHRFIGAADIWVSNISPHGPNGPDPGGVSFVVHVNHPSPLPVVTDIILFDPPDELIFP
jgi:hypothetical protein